MDIHHLKRGYDVRLAGQAQPTVVQAEFPSTVAIKPTDFFGVVPKLAVREGDAVKIGTPLFHSKVDENHRFCSPASGVVEAVTRGDRRALLQVVIKTDGKQASESVTTPAPAGLDRDAALHALTASGLFAYFIQRPLAVAASPADTPRDIFVPAMDTAPLAAKPAVALEGNLEHLRVGLQVLTALTTGSVHLCVNPEDNLELPEVENLERVQVHGFKGPHPAGNPGVHIHSISPIKGRQDLVWVCPLQGVILIGKLFNEGSVSTEIVVGVAGSSAPRHDYVRTVIGAPVATVLGADFDPTGKRIIAGDVLSGRRVATDGYLSFGTNLMTVIDEPAEPEFIGWMMPGLSKESRSGTFLSRWLGRGREFVKNAGTNGGERALIATGIYRDVTPIDLYPEVLLKSILAEDIEEMMTLGILDVAEEDLALCEYICPSKVNWQEVTRRGLELIRREA